MSSFRFALGLLVLPLLGACDVLIGDSGYIHNRSNQYLASSQGAPLVVPANLSKSQITRYYDIPEVKGELGVSMAPPGSSAERAGFGKHSAGLPTQPAIEQHDLILASRDKHNILIINQQFSQAWSFVGSALQRRRIPILIHKRTIKTYFIADTFITDDKINADTPIRQVHLSQFGNKTEVLITDNKGKAVNPATSQRLLEDLRLGLLGKRKKTFFGLV